MRNALSLLLPALLLVVAPPCVRGQVVRGQLLNGETGLPLEGAMIVLQGPGGEMGAALSNAAGRFLLRAPAAGTYTLRADRIGHASTTSDPFTLAPGDTVEIRMVARVSAIRLQGLEVAAERRCDVRPEAGRAVATVWEEARKALAAAAFTEATGIYRYRTIRFLRELDREGRRVRSEERQASQRFQRTPFESLPAEALVEGGFMRPDPDGDLYFAPDARVILSDPFLDTHCLRLTMGRGESAGLIGIGFEPIPGRDLPDIRGVVWVDPVSAELRRVEYTYENLDPALRSEAVGGDVAFKGLPDGRWIVTEWRIRMPSADLTGDFRGGRQMVLTGIREVGGQVDQVRDQAGEVILEAERATLAGVVLDESGTEPLAGARVGLVGTQSSALTDADGSFRLSGLSGGIYSVAFSHPRVPAFGGLPEPVEVELIPGSVASVRMVAPPLARLLEAACGEAERPQGSAVLTGSVLDGETGEPLPGATVRVLWSDYRFRGTAVPRSGAAGIQALMGMNEEGLVGEADVSGRYLTCGVPADHPLRLEAEAGELTSGVLELRVPPEAPLLRQDLHILATGTGSLRGIVVDMEDQGPLEGVRVSLEGAGSARALPAPADAALTGLSNADGHFRLENLPQGRYLLKAEVLGRRTLTDTVRIRPDRPLQVELHLPPEAIEVEGITVEVLSRTELDIRREGRTGATLDRLTPEEMDALRETTMNIVDVIRKMGSPRIRITEYGPQGFPLGFCMRWSRSGMRSISAAPASEVVEGLAQGVPGGCQAMLIVLDGIPIQGGLQLPASSFALDMDPEDIESVQVLSPVQAQFRYGSEGVYGALVIETRRGVRGGG